jgi:hypothetical protein
MPRDKWLMGSVAAQDTYNPEEGAFQAGIRATPWYDEFVAKYGEAPDLNTPDYNYRAAWAAGVRPTVRDPYDQLLHWDSRFKGENHPNRYVGGVDTLTGQLVGAVMGDVLAPEKKKRRK